MGVYYMLLYGCLDHEGRVVPYYWLYKNDKNK